MSRSELATPAARTNCSREITVVAVSTRIGLKKLLACSSIAVLFSGVFALAANAAPTITFAPDCPTPMPPPPDPPAAPTPCTPREGNRIQDTIRLEVTFSVTAPEALQTIELFIESTETDIPSPQNPVASQTFSASQQIRSAKITYDWKTRELTPLNGIYKITARARGHIDSNFATSPPRIKIFVDNPPETPDPPIVSGSARGVALSWDASPHEDVTEYVLYSAMTSSPDDEPRSSDFKKTIETTSTAAFDVQDSGTYWYKLQVRRRSATPTEYIASERSAQSEAAVVLRRPVDVTPRPEVTAAPARPRITPRPLPQFQAPNDLPDVPFSTVLDFGDLTGDELLDEPPKAPFERSAQEEPEDTTDQRRRLVTIAIASLLVTTWAVLTRGRLLA